MSLDEHGWAPKVTHHWDQVNLSPLGFLWRYGGWWRWLILVLGGVAGVLSHPVLGLALLGCAVGLAWFFRCPSRVIASDASSVLSPVDGVVDELAVTDGSSWLYGDALRIAICLSVLDAHATRAAVTGTVRTMVESPSVHRSTLSRDAGATNHRKEVWLFEAARYPLLLRQIAGAVARRVVFAPRTGDTVRAGAMIGMIRFGSRVEVRLPLHTGDVPTLWRGDRVRAGVSVLAQVEAPPAHGRGDGVPTQDRARLVEGCAGGGISTDGAEVIRIEGARCAVRQGTR